MALVQESHGIMNVFDHMGHGHHVEGCVGQARVLQWAHMHAQSVLGPGSFRGCGVDFLSFDLPTHLSQPGELAAVATTDVEQPTWGFSSQIERKQVRALALQSGGTQGCAIEPMNQGTASASYDRGFGLVREVVLINQGEIVFNRHGIQPEQAAGSVRTLFDLPDAGGGEHPVGEIRVQHLARCSAQKTIGPGLCANGLEHVFELSAT